MLEAPKWFWKPFYDIVNCVIRWSTHYLLVQYSYQTLNLTRVYEWETGHSEVLCLRTFRGRSIKFFGNPIDQVQTLWSLKKKKKFKFQFPFLTTNRRIQYKTPMFYGLFWETLHPKLHNINLYYVTHSLISRNPRKRMFLSSNLPLIVTFLSLNSWVLPLMQTTIEVNPHPHIAPCVHMWSVFIFLLFLFFLLCHLLNRWCTDMSRW